VSTPFLVTFFLYPDLSQPLWSPGSEFHSLGCFLSVFCLWLVHPSVISSWWVLLAQLLSFCILTCSSLCGLQFVSIPYLVTFFLCPDLSIPLQSRMWVPLTQSLSFHILTCPSLCGL
jgi:hypothetical protein